LRGGRWNLHRPTYPSAHRIRPTNQFRITTASPPILSQPIHPIKSNRLFSLYLLLKPKKMATFHGKYRIESARLKAWDYSKNAG